MSDSSMVWKPRIDEPSNPRPSSKMSSLSSDIGIEKCCQRPGRSMKRRSMILAPFSLASLRTSLGVMPSAPCPSRDEWFEKIRNRRHPEGCRRPDYPKRTAADKSTDVGAPKWPPTPNPRQRPGKAVALLDWPSVGDAGLGFRATHGVRERAGGARELA